MSSTLICPFIRGLHRSTGGPLNTTAKKCTSVHYKRIIIGCINNQR